VLVMGNLANHHAENHFQNDIDNFWNSSCIWQCLSHFHAFRFGAFDKTYSPTDLVENYNERKAEIQDLKRFFGKMVPNDTFVEIEFANNDQLFRFGIASLNSSGKPDYETMILEWDLKVNSEKMDSLIKPLGWTQQTLKTLKEKLDRADCIQIESGEPTKIGFKRSGMGMYFFNVFDSPMADSLINHYNDSCTYLYIDKNLVLEYGGGAVGTQCFF
jgi:hypothetical protein